MNAVHEVRVRAVAPWGKLIGGMAETSPSFDLVGGHIALDFVNTVMVEGRRLVDRVSTPEELTSWVAVSDLGTSYGVPTAIDDELHAQLVSLRTGLKACFDAVCADEPVPDESMLVVNDALRSDPGSELYSTPDGELARRPAVDLSVDASALRWVVADAAADLLAGEQAARLRRCANHDTCVLVFLDTSRSRNRRWCSMDLCGNRSKVAAYDARLRQRRADDGS